MKWVSENKRSTRDRWHQCNKTWKKNHDPTSKVTGISKDKDTTALPNVLVKKENTTMKKLTKGKVTGRIDTWLLLIMNENIPY